MSYFTSGLAATLIGVVTFTAACGGRTETPATDTASAVATTPTAAAAASGGWTYDQNKALEGYVVCTTCHQVSGLGTEGTYPPLAGSDIVQGDPARVVAIILHGLQGELNVGGKKYNNVMTPWGGVFDDTQIANIATYIRSQWGNSASQVTPDLVAKVRDRKSVV